MRGQIFEDRTTQSLYDQKGRLATLRAINIVAGALVNQDTRYVYGDPINPDLVTATLYPDSQTVLTQGPDAAWILGTGTDHIAVTFDRLGRDVMKTDQRGVEHTLERDAAGRIVADVVTTLPTSVDGTVRRIGMGFDDVGRGNRVTSYADVTGTQVVNEITYRFGSFGELRELAQDHSGPVTAASPKIVYDYNAFLRRTLTIYPNGRQVIQTFDALQRLDAQTDGVSPFATYTYQGMGNIVKVEHPKVTGGLTWSPVLDRFGRAQEIAWTRTDGTFADRFQYGYDNANRRVWRKIAATGAPNTQDEFLTYDTLDRLTSNKVGILTGTAPDYTGIQTPVTNLSWNLDPIGNWSQFGRSDASVSFVQNRSHNAANEIDIDTFDTNAPGNAIALVSGNAAGNWVDPRYDAAGNSTYLPLAGQESVSTNARLLTWDAWNRLASVLVDLNGNGVADPSDIQITKYGYDGKNQRIWSATYAPASSNYTRRDYLLNEAWQTLEERSGVVTDFNTQTTVPQIQYLWDARYIDTPVLRWRDANADGVWEETLYALNDANMHITALVDQNGAVVERYSYEAYGKRSILTPTFGARTASSYAWTYGFTGREWNAESGLWYFRNRMYSDSLGRFVSRDPMGYVDGMSLYQGYFAPSENDPSGLWEVLDSGNNRKSFKSRSGQEAPYNPETESPRYFDNDTLESLASLVKLKDDPAEIKNWAKKPDGTRKLKLMGGGEINLDSLSAADIKKTICPGEIVSVPNIWVAADLLQGGSRWYADPFINIGGTIGIFFGTDLLTFGKKIIKPTTFSDLENTLVTNNGDVWGMVVFGHGDTQGYLGDADSRNAGNQSVIIQKFANQGFKAAKIYAMQCYSAYVGNGYNWRSQWEAVSIVFYGYQGVNGGMIDW